ncbi:MAG TPA: class I SAM-dependent methyltransferase [Acidimicrobiales bacterium]|nr:class I SAM-dependent methyltransferase [Acidimicrobiales bacterium]
MRGAPTPGAGNLVARRVFQGLPDHYDRLAEWLSFGQNRRWRATLVDAVAAGDPGLVADVATGTAGVALALRARTAADVLGVDLDVGMIRRGRDNVGQADRARIGGASPTAAPRRATAGTIAFVVARGEQLPLGDASVDALSFTYLLRYVDDPEATLAELARVVRPGGVVANLEFAVPESSPWRGLWWVYTRVALPLGGLVTGGPPWFRVGRFLGPSITDHYRRYPIDWTVKAWERAGIGEVTVRRMSLGGGVVMWGRRK